MSESKSIARGTGIVGALTLVSRALGFVRDMLVARTFGASPFADAFFVAFRIPNLLRSLVAEGAMTSAFVPVFANELKQSKNAAQAALSSAVSFILLATAILSLLGMFFASQIVIFFAPGFFVDKSKFELCVLLTRIMMPYITCVSLVALLNGALNSLNIFGASAIAQVVMNIALIVGAVIASFTESWIGAIILSASVLVGGILQLIAQLPALSRANLRLFKFGPLFSTQNKQIVCLMLPAVIGATVYQFSIFLNTLFASLLPSGSVSWLYYADRLTQLPIGIFTISLASVLLPSLARSHSAGDKNSFGKGLVDSLRYTSFLMLPIVCGMAYLAPTLVSFLFQRGAFDAYSSQQSAMAVQAYCLGLWAVSCHSLIARAFIAQRDTVTTTLVGLATLAFNVLFSILLSGSSVNNDGSQISGLIIAANLTLHNFIPLAFDNLGHTGLALSSSLSSILSFVIIGLLIARKNRNISWGAFFRSTLQSALACSVMIATLWAIQQVNLGPMLSLLLSIAAACLSYAASCLVQKMPEAQETISLIFRLINRKNERGQN